MAGASVSPRRRPALAAAAVIFVGLGLFAAVTFMAGAGQSSIADMISHAVSTPERKVSIGGVDDLLSSAITIRDVRVEDRDGTWLDVDRIHIAWSPLSLLRLRLEIDALEVDRMDIARKPAAGEAQASRGEKMGFPELPLAVEIKRFSLGEAFVGAPILGTSASFSASGSARLGPPSAGLDLVLDVQRLDRPAKLDARLNFVPETKVLRASLDLDEAEGGILARLADLPGRPPVKLNIAANGTLDDIQAKLGFDAGRGLGAKGEAKVIREGAARKLSLAFGTEAAGLLPKAMAPIFAGTTELTGSVVFQDDGTIEIPGLELVAAAARLDIEGNLGPARTLDIRLSGTNIANMENGGTALENAEIKRFALDARVTGSLDAPSVEGTSSVEAARLPSISLGSLSTSFKAIPVGGVSEGPASLGLSAEARVKGLALADPALARAIGSELAFAMRGTGTTAGLVDVEFSKVETPTLSAGFKGRVSATDVNGRLDAEAPDLSRFGMIAGRQLQGAAKLAAEIRRTPDDKRLAVTIDADASRFASGIAPIDGLVGGTLQLAGGLGYGPDGSLGFDDLRLIAPNASARVNGTATPEAADILINATIPSLSKADTRLSGRGELAARIKGTLERPDATATLMISDGSMLGRSVPHLGVTVDAKDLLGTLDARLRLDGDINGKPARGGLHLARRLDGTTILDNLDMSIGSVGVTGAVTLDPAHLAAGQLVVHAGSLDDLSPLLLRKISGSLDADVTLAQANSRQDVALEAKGQKIDGFGARLEKLVADLRVTDLYHRPVISGSLEANDATVSGQTISRLRLDAKGGAEASDLTLTAAARGLDLEAKARAIASDPFRVEVSKFDARRGRTRIGLAGPATLTIANGGADIRNLALNLNGGRLTLDGRAGPILDLSLNARKVPLSVADIAMPDLGLGGTFDGEAKVAGEMAALSGNYRFRVENFAMPQTKNAGLPPINANATGRLDGARTLLEATILAGKAGTLRLAGSAPLGADGTLDLTIKGNLDAGVANRTLGATGRRVTGEVAVDGHLTGVVRQPQATGSIILSNGSFQDASMGTRFDAIRARILARGDKLTIESASATTRNGGSITASGDIRLDPAGGFPGSVTVRGRNAELVRSSLATAVVDLDLDMIGPLARDPRLGGRIGIQSLDISIPDQLSGPGQPLEGTRHIRPTPTAAQRLALADRGKETEDGPSFNAALDLTIDVPGHIRVEGRGLDAELGGSVKVRGTLAEPKPVGAFHLVEGRLRVLTSQLDFVRANLTFAGDLSPQLDFLATTQAGGASIKIAITGDPSNPQFAFASSPDLPQDEILSRLLFGQGSGQLTATQALALSQAVAIYSGGNSALEGLRRSLGLGDASKSSNPLTNWLGDRVSVGIRTGATPAQTGVGMDISIWKQFKARGSIDAKGDARAGVGAEYEW